MTDKKQQERDMQEALDAALEPEAYRKLMEDVETDPDASAEYGRLQSVDGMMREARTEAAPDSLAQGILARIAQKERLPAPLPQTAGRAVALGLGITAVVVLPLLVLLSLGILSAFGAGSALSSAALAVIAVVAYLYSLLTAAQTVITGNWLIFALLLLIPLAWFGLWRLGQSWAEHHHE
jgi:hypothetical protein